MPNMHSEKEEEVFYPFPAYILAAAREKKQNYDSGINLVIEPAAVDTVSAT
jgi:hypothetical protein